MHSSSFGINIDICTNTKQYHKIRAASLIAIYIEQDGDDNATSGEIDDRPCIDSHNHFVSTCLLFLL